MFTDAVNEDKDELANELDEMMALDAMEDDVIVPSGDIIPSAQPA